ncbi:MAG: hypothetical protein ACTSRS_12600 [Candidatus Helarchaeota archaeon]
MVNNVTNKNLKPGDPTFKRFRSTRHAAAPEAPTHAPPRLGRRESEPHSLGLYRIYDILTTHFPNYRVMIDLHHYFYLKGEKLDLQFDLTVFTNLKLNYTLSSYDSAKFDNKIPLMAINILSKSTYLKDLGFLKDLCQELKIPLYVIFSTHNISILLYKPPFLRVHFLNKDGTYQEKTIRGELYDEQGRILEHNIIDTSQIIPFKLSLMKSNLIHEGGSPNYDLVFLNPATNKPYKPRIELEKERADKEKERADKEKERADKEKERADKEKERADKLEHMLEEYKRKIK